MSFLLRRKYWIDRNARAWPKRWVRLHAFILDKLEEKVASISGAFNLCLLACKYMIASSISSAWNACQLACHYELAAPYPASDYNACQLAVHDEGAKVPSSTLNVCQLDQEVAVAQPSSAYDVDVLEP